MEAAEEKLVCASGHASTERDYCSECGARLEGSPARRGTTDVSETARKGTQCPDCGLFIEGQALSFCEICGYNFVTGTRGEIALDVSPEDQPIQAPAVTETIESQGDAHGTEDKPEGRWEILVSVDAALGKEGSPELPGVFEPRKLRLGSSSVLIGRRDAGRGILPEIDLAHDEAVSRRHALLMQTEQGQVIVRDVGAANGTRLNGIELEPMVDYPLKEGDLLTLGHWSRLLLQRPEQGTR